jgi:peroxiredoxin
MQSSKMAAGAVFPAMSWPVVDGGVINPSADEGWRILIVYRGKHCPLCKTYLNTLYELLPEFRAIGVSVYALSADTQAKALADVEEHGWKLQVGYDLTPDQMRQLGLYVSNPRSPEETDRQFAEPGLFVINPAGRTQIIDISNAPFVRPELGGLLFALKYLTANDYPIRGTG